METKEKVYRFISNELTKGRLNRTDRITEQYLANNLGISRTPIREALVQLAADEILEREPRKGFKIKTYTKKDIENLYEIIGVLDGKIAQLSLPYLTEQDFALMKFLIDSMHSAINNELYTKYNELQQQFHQVYIEKCNNAMLVTELMNKKKIFIGKAYSRVAQDQLQELLNVTNKEHEEILALFIAGKGAEVRDFLENQHWRKGNAQYDIW